MRWSSGSLPTDLQYTGQRNETTLGIYDYKARFYSPRLGRFLSADTLVPGVGSQHLSRYMYVTGNPVRYNDPTGHARPTEESENYNWTTSSGYPGLPGWYEAGIAYQKYLQARYEYADNPAIVADYQAGFEQARDRARAAMPQVLWTADNVASLYDAAGTMGVGMGAALLSGGPDEFAPGSVPESVRHDVLGDPDCVGCGYAGSRITSAPTSPFLPTSPSGNNAKDIEAEQRALRDIINQITYKGRKPLSSQDANAALDLALEVQYPGARASSDDLATVNNHWAGGPHIHIPGAGRGGHIPVNPIGVIPR